MYCNNLPKAHHGTLFSPQHCSVNCAMCVLPPLSTGNDAREAVTIRAWSNDSIGLGSVSVQASATIFVLKFVCSSTM